MHEYSEGSLENMACSNNDTHTFQVDLGCYGTRRPSAIGKAEKRCVNEIHAGIYSSSEPNAPASKPGSM